MSYAKISRLEKEICMIKATIKTQKKAIYNLVAKIKRKKIDMEQDQTWLESLSKEHDVCKQVIEDGKET